MAYTYKHALRALPNKQRRQLAIARKHAKEIGLTFRDQIDKRYFSNLEWLSCYLACAFCWEQSPQGDRYWGEVVESIRAKGK